MPAGSLLEQTGRRLSACGLGEETGGKGLGTSWSRCWRGWAVDRSVCGSHLLESKARKDRLPPGKVQDTPGSPPRRYCCLMQHLGQRPGIGKSPETGCVVCWVSPVKSCEARLEECSPKMTLHGSQLLFTGDEYVVPTCSFPFLAHNLRGREKEEMTVLPWPRRVTAARSGHLWSNQFSGMEAHPPCPGVQEQVPQRDGRRQRAATEIPRHLLAAGAELGLGFLFRVLVPHLQT